MQAAGQSPLEALAVELRGHPHRRLIEQAVVSSLYTAFSRQEELTTEALVEEIGLTRPLSVTMAERIGTLRDWARDRAVFAG